MQQLDVPQEYRKYYNIALKKQRKKGNLHLFTHFNPFKEFEFFSNVLESLECKTVRVGGNMLITSSRPKSNGTPLQYSCLENPMERGAWWAAVHGVADSQT